MNYDFNESTLIFSQQIDKVNSFQINSNPSESSASPLCFETITSSFLSSGLRLLASWMFMGDRCLVGFFAKSSLKAGLCGGDFVLGVSACSPSTLACFSPGGFVYYLFGSAMPTVCDF